MSFKDGFRLGADVGMRRREMALAEERDKRAAEQHKAELEERGLRTDGLRRAAAKENQLTGLRTEMADFQQGIDRPATNAALDADFEAANQAALGGLALPAVRGGSNAANEAALTVKKPVDVNSPEFQGGMAGLRSRYALASGDMKDFDAVTAAERSRVRGSEDSAFALSIMQDPTGEAARSARAFINAKSGKLSSKVDPKTGMTTFARVNGDGYDEINVSPTDLGKIAMGYKRLERGDVSGLDLIAAVNKDLAATVREEMKLDLDLGKTNNTAAYQGGQLANDAERTRNQREYQQGMLGLSRQRLDADIARANKTARQGADAAAFANQIDGVMEGYQAAAAQGLTQAAGIYAREYDQLRATAAARGMKVPPSLQSLVAAQKQGGQSKPVKIEEGGQRYLVDGQVRLSDGRGGFIAESGVLPDELSGYLASAGVPQAILSKLQPNRDGTEVAFRGMAYNLRDPNDLRALINDSRRLGANDLQVDEYQKQMGGVARGSGLGSRLTYLPSGGAPSIYAGEDEWARYRAAQQTR